ncbi:hypothetical protein VTK73DRAFT_559 [Phialemonium thermophilum]|uniref:Uncharacterized protein n=1 Tax=Phialemonium thermophilum TaxID=223376 RepID=A0ABR3VUU5_9PEZI
MPPSRAWEGVAAAAAEMPKVAGPVAAVHPLRDVEGGLGAERSLLHERVGDLEAKRSRHAREAGREVGRSRPRGTAVAQGEVHNQSLPARSAAPRHPSISCETEAGREGEPRRRQTRARREQRRLARRQAGAAAAVVVDAVESVGRTVRMVVVVAAAAAAVAAVTMQAAQVVPAGHTSSGAGRPPGTRAAVAALRPGCRPFCCRNTWFVYFFFFLTLLWLRTWGGSARLRISPRQGKTRNKRERVPSRCARSK